MQFLSKTIECAFDGCTVQSVLQTVFSVSATYLKQLKRRPGSVLLNGSPVYLVARVKAGDTVAFDPSDAAVLPIRPIAFPLSVLYDDEWLTVIDKPNGLPVHPARDPNEPTVENALAARYAGNGNPHPVSRLDKGTTGLLTVAKSGYVHARMKQEQTDGRFQKTYLAVLSRVPESAHAVIETPIGPLEGSTYQRTVREDGAPSKSEYTLLAVRDNLALVRLIPHTGRTHQLRVHMAYAGTPIFGDWLYGQRSDAVDRPLLHADTLSFTHPITGEPMRFSAPLPDDFLRYFPSPM